jgi:phosphoglucan,water dikinase
MKRCPRMDDVAEKIIAADKRCRSWREKLDFVRELFAGEAQPDAGQLADIAIYLRFLGAGQIRCEEDGRHFRPAHHARIASEIHQHLAQFTDAEDFWIARKIYPALPSTARTFQRAEPLTRIRDIAHRNDIPSELKKEIKTTLQNKLHRCAGPEDLVTSGKILERITAPGANYSADFVGQFKIFHDELKEFFNARSLDEQLTALAEILAGDGAQLIRDFLAAKSESLGGADRAMPAGQLNTFRLLTGLRERFLSAVRENSGHSQELLLADIALEDFAFALMSELLNALDAEKSKPDWVSLLDALQLTIKNLILSGIETDECRAIESELRAWCRDFNPAVRENMLRIKATADRARRVAENFSDRIAALFPPRVEKLGRALGVEQHAIRVFCEAEIRGHLVFQLSKLVSNLSRRIRERLALPAWDVIVSGHATGRIRAASSLDELNFDLNESALVLLQKAEGDEEIPRGVIGIVLAHELPHLSHLGVRARQAGIVFVACDEPAKFQELQRLCDQKLTLIATPENFEFSENGAIPDVARNAKSGTVEIPEVNLESKNAWLPLEKISQKTGGGKADGMRRLAELAARSDPAFRAPAAIVIPFGVMENALRRAAKFESEYRSLIERLNEMSANEFARTIERLREIIRQAAAPDEIISAAEKFFGVNARLMVRSSANCEDLEQLAGAGIYDSIPNVAPADIADAVRDVWSSLWTPRAAASRKQAGIPHETAHMAVLIQEMLAPDFSFVLHTTNPVSNNPRDLYAEIAVGLGETLASAAARGSPYRLVCDKISGEVTMLAFANFSHALRAGEHGVIAERLDYSQVRMSRDSQFRREVGGRIMNIAKFIENEFGKPQDIEGAIVGDEIFLVQSRAQQGLTKTETDKKSTEGNKENKAEKSSFTSFASVEKSVQPKPPPRAKKSPEPLTLGLFEKRIDGDDCLIELAKLRFHQAQMGAEMHAGTTEHLEWLMKFRPWPDAPVTLHLPRDFNLMNSECHNRIADFAARFAGRIHGMILHDHKDLANRRDDYIRAAHKMNSRLQQIPRAPLLFIEYAACLEFEVFTNFFKTIRDLKQIGTCIDIGHVGIRQAQKTYSEIYPGEDICALKSQPADLPARMADVEKSVHSALPAVLDLIESIGTLGKPLHFHLHDGHPLSTFSMFGVSDHLSFFSEIPLNFEFRGRRAVPPMFGRDGLFKIVAATLKSLDAAQASFTLEIHPTNEQQPLGDAAQMFSHWRDKTNAEKMNHWLCVLRSNHELLREAIGSARQTGSGDQ